MLLPLIRYGDDRARGFEAEEEEAEGEELDRLMVAQGIGERPETPPKEPPKWSLDDFEK
ncbi:MAG: hypothetical protein ABSE86_11760 [Bryobacteraceae bacterium]|jgi:hypothetical protein